MRQAAGNRAPGIGETGRGKSQGRRPWRRYLPVVFIACLGAALTLLGAVALSRWERAQSELRFDQHGTQLAVAIQRRIDEAVEIVRSIRSLYEASPRVTRQQFRAFVGRSLARDRGIQALEWIPRVPAAERDAYEEAARRDGHPQFEITERERQAQMVRASRRSEYFPVYFVEPFKGNEIALGFDLASDPVRLAALEQACDTGAAVATARITLVQETGRQYGFLIYDPVYRSGSTPETVEARRRDLVGFALGVLRAGDLIEEALKGLHASDVALTLLDDSAPASERLLYRRMSDNGNPGVEAVKESGAGPKPPFIWRQRFDVAGRRWSLLFLGGDSYARAFPDWQPWGILGLGLLLTVTLTAYMATTINRNLLLAMAKESLEQEIDARTQAEESLAARTRQLEAVRAVSHEITGELDLPRLFEVIHRQAANLLGASGGAIFLWDEAEQVLVPFPWHGLGDWMAAARRPLGQGVTGVVAQRRKGLIVNDYRTSPLAYPGTLEHTEIRAVVAEPLLYQDRLVGVITVHDERAGRLFTEQDRQTLELLAGQIAIAIENARLHAAALQRGEELAALLRSGRVVMGGLDLEGTLDRIIGEASEIAHTPHVKVLLAGEQDGKLCMAAVRGRPVEMIRRFEYGFEGSLSGIVATTGQPLFVADCQNDPRNIASEQDRMFGIQTYLGLPIKGQDEILGVLTFNTTVPRRYTPGEIAYLTSFADEAAIAIENARLYAASEERAQALEVLREIDHAITSRLELGEVLEAVVAGAMRLLNNPSAQIILWDEAAQRLRYGAARGPETDRVKGQVFELGRGINGIVAQTRQPMILDDYQTSPYVLPECFDVTATITVPILFEGRLSGVLHSHTTQAGRRFTPRDLHRLQMLAAQAAIAIENARLYDEIQRYAADLEERVAARTAELAAANEELAAASRHKSEFLANMSHELRTPLNGILGFAQILQEQVGAALSEKQRRYLGHIYGSGQHLLTLINDILDLAKVEAGKIALQPEPLPVAQTLEDLLVIARGLASEKGQVLTAAIAPDLPPLTADPVRVKQILFNLLSNAVKFTPEQGTMTLTAKRHDGEVTRHPSSPAVPRTRRDRHRGRHQGGGPPQALPRVHPARDHPYAGARGHRPWPRPHQAPGRAPRRPDLGRLPGRGPGEHLHGGPAPGRVSRMSRQRNRDDRLAAFLQASQAMASSLDLDQVLRTVVEAAAAISGAPFVRLFLLEGAPPMLHWRVGVGLSPEGEPNRPIRIGESFSGQVAVTGQPLAVADCREDPRLRFPEHIQRYSLISYLGLPVKTGDRLLGVLCFNTNAPHVYTEEEISFLNAFAQQAAIAIENARLHEATERELAERIRVEEDLRQSEQTRRLAQENATMAELGRIISSTLNIEEVYKSFAAEVRKILPFDRILINHIEPDKGLVRNLFIAGETIPGRTASDSYPLEGSGIAEMVRTRASLLIQTDDFREYADRFSGLVSTFKAGFRSILNVPLFAQAQVIGGLLLRSRQANAYTDRDIRLAERIADQIAGTVANAQLYAENVRLYEMAQQEIVERRQAEETLTLRTRHLEAVRSISEEIARELDLSRVLDLVVQRAVALVGAKSGSIRLWDNQRQLLMRVAWTGSAQHAPTVPLGLGEGVPGAAAQQRRGLIVNDFRTSAYAIPAVLQGTMHTAVVATPLLFGDRLVGALAITRDASDPPFADADLEILNLLAPHAAIAIENARLHGQALRRSDETIALLRTTHAVMSGLDLNVSLQRILEEAGPMAGTPHVKILLVDENAGVLRLAATSGVPMPAEFQVAIGTSFSGTVAATGRPLFVADTQTDPRNLFRDRDREEGVRTYLGLPIRRRSKVLGVLIFNTAQSRSYSEEEIGYLEAFADQAAIAIENARLYEEVQRHAGELETRVKERTSELEEALRVKAEFLARMSHELRTPLNFVLGFANLLKEQTAGPLTDKQMRFVDRIEFGGRHLLALVSDLLELSQVEMGQEELRLEQFLLVPLLEEVVEIHAVPAGQKRHVIEVECPPALSVVAERRRLLQILSNLVSNAVKFTPEGGRITVTARQVAEDRRPETGVPPGPPAPVPWVELAVTDTGIGLAPEDVERIFVGFEQVDGSSTRRYEGAGIGLALVRTLVNLHGGQVWAESAGLGQGSRFVVRLPVLAVPSARRVLVVEDEAPVARLLAIFLRDAGYAVEVAGTGGEAVARLHVQPPDLIVLDLALPDMDGWEVLRTVRARARTRALPVVVLTGLGPEQAAQAAARGADEFLTKPVSPTVLTGVVKTLVARAREAAHVPPLAGTGGWQAMAEETGGAGGGRT